MKHPFVNYFGCPDLWPALESAEGTTAETDCCADLGAAIERIRSRSKALANLAGPVPRNRCELLMQGGGLMEALRRETYASEERIADRSFRDRGIRSAYYLVRPVLPVPLRKHLQKLRLRDWNDATFPAWPVDFSVDEIARAWMLAALRCGNRKSIPFIWFWPDGANSCAVMTHDVETKRGRDHCDAVMDVNDKFAVKSSFQVVPEKRYTVTAEYLESIRVRGFEINVQDLNHDGHLYSSRKLFMERVSKINSYAASWEALGFRAAVLYRNQSWFQHLSFEYDMSVPNVAHLDPQRGGCCTVMPYFIGHLLEIPVTTTQDYSLLHILREYSLDLWKKQVQLITRNNGLASFIVHPDYIIDRRASTLYESLLDHLITLRERQKLWFAKPGELNRWWRMRSQMCLVETDRGWIIEGEGSARARIAYAVEVDGRLEFEIEQSPSKQQCEPRLSVLCPAK